MVTIHSHPLMIGRSCSMGLGGLAQMESQELGSSTVRDGIKSLQ